MVTATLSEKDHRVRDAVAQQLEWDPSIDASDVAVTARDGSVTLTGVVATYAGKLAAERAAKRVGGVRAVANELEVRLAVGRTDVDIAADAAAILRMHHEIPDSVQAVVHHGHLTLTGIVDWHYQRLQAEKAVRYIRGVRHVLDHIEVRPRAAGVDLRHRITQALHRNASLDAQQIQVTVSGGGSVVHLQGTASSWQQRQAAERAAFDAPGVTTVDNQIVVDPPDGDSCEIC